MSLNVNELTFSLTDEQTALVNAPIDGPDLAVLAGPGVGKTRALALRVAFLIGAGVCDLVILTFGRAAANELRERVEAIVKVPSTVFIGTFHSYCQRQIRLAGTALELASDFETKSAMNLDPEGDGEALLTGEGLSTFDHLLELERFGILTPGGHTVLVDEFQDLKPTMLDLAVALSRGGRLEVVGDHDQSIYGFNGVDGEILEDFCTPKGHFASVERKLTVIRLSVSHRCPQPALEAASRLIQHNPSKSRVICFPVSVVILDARVNT